jgi:N5-(carboxyethyl)ornithine synthase
MKTVGFPISRKENEKRRAIVPQDISKIRHPELLFFETGYGAVLGISDEDYIKAGANITSCEEVLKKRYYMRPKGRGCGLFEHFVKSDCLWMDSCRSESRHYRQIN